jgi:Flp pilus assembly pilin Flp
MPCVGSGGSNTRPSRRFLQAAIYKAIIFSGWKDSTMLDVARTLWTDQDGQDIAEYAVMLAVILVLVVGTIRLVGSNANNVFSSAASSIQ